MAEHESKLTIEGGFNYPDAPGKIIIRETQSTEYNSPEQLISELDGKRFLGRLDHIAGFGLYALSVGGIMVGLSEDSFARAAIIGGMTLGGFIGGTVFHALGLDIAERDKIIREQLKLSQRIEVGIPEISTPNSA